MSSKHLLESEWFKSFIVLQVSQRLFISSAGSAEHGNIVSLGSFSTIFSPGLQIGWLEAPQNVLGHLKNRYA